MKNKMYIVKKLGFSLIIGLFLVIGCKKETALPEAPRLFRPVVNGELTGSSNWIEAKWTKVLGAVSYSVEISADTFKTIVKSVKLDTNDAVFENLGWYTLYQVRVKAIAADEAKNSGFSVLGSKKTEKFPSIMQAPLTTEILDKAVIIRWTNSGAAATNITFYLKSNGSVAKDVPFTAQDIANQYKIVSGLTPATNYTVKIFSSSTLRGYEDFTTLPQIITGSNIVDISTKINADTITAAFLAALPDGALVVLRRGFTYNITGGINIAKAVTFISESNFGAPATMNLVGNFNITASSTIGTIAFNTLSLIGNAADGYGSRYVFNINVACAINTINFENCKIKAVRGVLRTQAGPVIQNVNFNNCLIDSISNYGVVNCDNAASSIMNTKLTNSTVSDAQKVFTSKSALTSATVENCTFYFAPLSPNYFFDYNTFTVANGISIKNCIFGAGKPTTAVPPVSTVSGFRPLIINVTSQGNFKTSDLTFAVGYEIPGLTDYTGTSAALFKSPGTDNFTILDTRFAGKSTSGDPRWRL